MSKFQSSRPRLDIRTARSAEVLRAHLANRAQTIRILQSEPAAARFLDDCAQLLNLAERMHAEADELRLIHESTLEHATDIENELELSSRVINDDLLVAEKVQKALLPDPKLVFGSEFEIAIYHKQLRKVGGDFYDFFTLPNGEYAITVCDVSGHGVSSALVTTFLRAQFAQATKILSSPSAIIDWVNQSASAFLQKGVRHYSSTAFASFSREFCRYVAAGGYGVWARKNQTARSLKRTSNLIGLSAVPFQEFEVPFLAGDILAFYSDGMFAAQDAQERFYGVRRLNELIQNHVEKSPQEILEYCIKDYVGYRQADADDITLIIMRRR